MKLAFNRRENLAHVVSCFGHSGYPYNISMVDLPVDVALRMEFSLHEAFLILSDHNPPTSSMQTIDHFRVISKNDPIPGFPLEPKLQLIARVSNW